MIFGPKPPPTMGAITRTRRSLRPSMPARPLRRNTGLWVASAKERAFGATTMKSWMSTRRPARAPPPKI